MVCDCPVTFVLLHMSSDTQPDFVEVEGLAEPHIVKNEIDRLVMDPTNKEVIKAIAKTYTDNDLADSEFFRADFIHGKGEGQILLLHGPPGTGKTLTAGKVIVAAMLI